MPDGNFGERDIFLDLTAVPAARVIRASPPHHVKINGIRINGTAGAAIGHIILRKQSATGPIIFELIVAASSVHDGTFAIHGGPIVDGLFMDSVGTAWLAESHMIIHTN